MAGLKKARKLAAQQAAAKKSQQYGAKVMTAAQAAPSVTTASAPVVPQYVSPFVQTTRDFGKP